MQRFNFFRNYDKKEKKKYIEIQIISDYLKNDIAGMTVEKVYCLVLRRKSEGPFI